MFISIADTVKLANSSRNQEGKSMVYSLPRPLKPPSGKDLQQSRIRIAMTTRFMS